MIELKTFAALASVPIGSFADKPTTLTEGQKEATNPLWSSPEGDTHIGVWECTPGRFTADRTAGGEYCPEGANLAPNSLSRQRQPLRT